MIPDLAFVQRFLGEDCFSAGEQLTQAGKVAMVRQVDAGDADITVTGRVNDSSVARVFIRIADNTIDGECSCEHGVNCQHVAAVLIQTISNQFAAVEAAVQKSVKASIQTGNPTSVQTEQLAASQDRSNSPTQSTIQRPTYNQAISARPLPVADQRLVYCLETVSGLTDTGVTTAQDMIGIADGCVKNSRSLNLSLWIDNAAGDIAPYILQRYRSGRFPRYIQPQDKIILSKLNQNIVPTSSTASSTTSSISTQFSLQGVTGVALMNLCLASERCYWRRPSQQLLNKADGKPGSLAWLMLDNTHQQLDVGIPDEQYVLPFLTPVQYINPDAGLIGELILACGAESLAKLATRSALTAEQVDGVNAEFVLDKGLPQAREVSIKPVPTSSIRAKLRLFGDVQSARAELSFIYNEQSENTFLRPSAVPCLRYWLQGTCYQVERDIDAENRLAFQLKEFVGDEVCLSLPDRATWLDFMLHKRVDLQRSGWEFEIEESFPYQLAEVGDWYSNIQKRTNLKGIEKPQDWFSLELGMMVNNEPINILPLLVQLLNSDFMHELTLPAKGLTTEGEPTEKNDRVFFLHLPDGRYLPVPVERVQQIFEVLSELLTENSLIDEGLVLPVNQMTRMVQLATEVFSAAEQDLLWLGDHEIKQLVEKLADFDRIQPLQPPETFKATLRNYQQEGLGWLQFLREFQFNGILADDMGLGKTVQTLAHLALEKSCGRLVLPALILSPTSVLGNWRDEARRFSPELKVLALQGPNRGQLFSQLGDADVILSSYPLLKFDYDVLVEQDYSVLILDEAQNIKNHRTQAAQIVRQINSEYRLCLTGTPMENHLGELWALFDFLQPGLLGSQRNFDQHYRQPIEVAANELRLDSLKKRLAPFILRRTKQLVAPELPTKTEIVQRAVMGDKQRDLYDGIRLTMHKEVREIIREQGAGKVQLAVLDALLKLRQVCCDPRLLPSAISKDVTTSAKFEMLMNMLTELTREGRRILLFSQFTSMLGLIADAVSARNIGYVMLDGQTKNRDAVVAKFQHEAVPLFLISLKAGGTGLNLTAADTVIHYDPWWNPAVENQATDRAYRIGQDKQVFVYKLIVEGSVEEKILDLQKNKAGLAESIYAAKSSAPGKLNANDLMGLLQP